MILEGLKGPLNVLFYIILLFFFASIARVARFHIVSIKKSKKINFASESFMIWAFDKFICIG